MKKGILLLILFSILVIGGYLFFEYKNSKKYTILVVSNDILSNKKKEKILQLSKEKIISQIEKRYPDIKIKWLNFELKSPQEIKRDKKILKEIFKHEKIIYIIFGTISKMLNTFGDILPKDIPIFSGASSPFALNKYNGKIIFTNTPTPYYSRVKYIFNLKDILKLKNIIFLMNKDIKKVPYGYAIYTAAKRNKKDITLISVEQFLENKKEFINIYKNYLWCIDINDRSRDIKKFINSHLNIKGLNIFVIYYTNYKNTKANIFFASTIKKVKDPFEYNYLKDIRDYNNPIDIHTFDRYYRNYYPRIMIVLENIKDFNNSIKDIRKNIFEILKSYSKRVYIQKDTKNIIFFEKKDIRELIETNKEKYIYYNNIYKRKDIGLKNKFIIKLEDNTRTLLPLQYIEDINGSYKKIPVVDIKPFIKNIEILNLSTDIALVDLYLTIKYLKDYNISYPHNFQILPIAQFKNKTELSLVKSYTKDKFKYKIYRIKVYTPVENDLFFFPFDKFTIRVEFIINNYQKMPIILNIDDTYIPKNIRNWNIENIFATYAENPLVISQKENEIAYLYKNFLDIKIKRDRPIMVLIKYLLPALLLFIIGLYSAYKILILKRSEDGIGIIVDSILGIISVYFIFSLLISIKDLILMDIIFYILITILTILALLIFYKQKT